MHTRGLLRWNTMTSVRARVSYHAHGALAQLDPRRFAAARGVSAAAPAVDLVVVTRALVAGGVERMLLNLVAALEKRGLTVAVVVTSRADHVWASEVQADRFFDLFRIAPPSRAVRVLTDLVVASGAQTLLLSNSDPGYESLRELRRRGWSGRAVDLLHTPGRPEEKDAYLRSSRRFSRHLDERVVISRYLANYLDERGYGLPALPVRVIPNAVPSSGLEMEAARSGALWLGRLEVDKDPFEMLAVAAALQRLDPTLRVSIAGDGSLRNRLETASRCMGLHGFVTMLGHREDVPQLLQRHAVLVNTSPLEGQPIAVLEALACGMPAVAYGVGGLPEMARHLTGLSVVPREEGALGLAVAAHAASTRNWPDLRSEARKLWSAHVEAYADVLQLGKGEGE